jgi:hypothetical protein
VVLVVHTGQLVDQVVHDAEVGVGHPPEDLGRHELGQGPDEHHGDDHEQPDAAADPAHQQRDAQADQNRDQDRDEGEGHRTPDDGPEDVVAEHPGVLVEADPRGRAPAEQLAQAHVLEGQDDHPDQRITQQAGDQQEGGQGEQPRGTAATARAALGRGVTGPVGP